MSRAPGTADPSRQVSRWAWAADALLAVGLAAATAFATRGQSQLITGVAPLPLPPKLPPVAPVYPVIVPTAAHSWQILVAALTALPLAFRRRYPLATFWVVVGATLLLHGGAHPDRTAVLTLASTLIAAYSAAMYSPRRRPAVASLLAGAALVAAFHRETLPSLGKGYVPFVVVVAVGLVANVVYGWKQRIRALEEEHEAATRTAIDQERARIARELHDVVTHNVSVMVVQAGAARSVIDTAPDQARAALQAVEAGGRAAMAELRHVMGLLTMGADGPDPAGIDGLAPQPGLAQLPALVDRVTRTGVSTELTVTGTGVALPPGVDLAAYRVVQEALTNTVKHAGGASVTITVDHTPGAVRVDVADTGGTPTASTRSGSGRGLIGLRERLAVYGATLEAGPRPTGGYRVHAEFPLERP